MGKPTTSTKPTMVSMGIPYEFSSGICLPKNSIPSLELQNVHAWQLKHDGNILRNLLLGTFS